MASEKVLYKAEDGTLINLSTKVINNTTTDSTTDALSAAQGKVLASKFTTLTKSSVGLGNVDNTADADKSVKAATKLQTYHADSTTNTYGDNYPLYAQWDGNIVNLKVDNYKVKTDSATNADNASSATKLSSSAGSSVQPVYFVDGKPAVIGYTINKSVPADAKFTDTTYPLVTSAVDGLMRKADKSKLDGLYDVKSFTKSLIVNTDWTDTGITGTDIDTGTYAVRVEVPKNEPIGLYNECWSGIMSWFSGGTNDLNGDEILLHNAGHAENAGKIYLRTLRVSGGNNMKLQIASKIKFPSALNVVFKFRRLV